MNIFVTGATGFVGRQVVEQLLRAGVGVRNSATAGLPAEVEVTQGDLTAPASLVALMRLKQRRLKRTITVTRQRDARIAGRGAQRAGTFAIPAITRVAAFGRIGWIANMCG